MQLLILSVMLFGLALADVSHLHRGSHFGGSLNSNHHTGHESGKMYARILKNDYVNDGHGSYNFAYETENGISHNEDGAPGNSKRGQYSYTGDDGKVYTVMYWADESGFHAVGDHLPGSQNSGTAGLKSPNGYGQPSVYNNKPKVSGNVGGNYNYPKPPAVKNSGYDYAKPKQAYLPPAPATDYLPPKF